MRKFMINVNGTSYNVEVEEIIGGAHAPTTIAPQPMAAAPAPAVQSPAPGAAAGEKVASPMPGNILDVKVKAGDTVKEGDILCVLEAMKMENEILAPCSGKVAAVEVAKGAAVNSGDVLFVIA